MKSLSLIVCGIFVKITFWTFDLDPRSKVMAPNESPYMISYMCIIQMKSLAIIISEIFAKKRFWPLTLDQGQRSWHQMKALIWFPICLQYKWSLQLTWLQRYCGFSRNVQKCIPTDRPTGSPIELLRQLKTTYEVSVFHSLWDICQKKHFDLWPWTEVKGHSPRSKVIAPN